MNLLRHAFSLACKQWDILGKNPFDKIKLPSGDRKRVRYLSPDEEHVLLDALSTRDRGWLLSVVIIARETGLRLSNICNLTWKQCDLVNGSIEIEKTKNGKPVWIPMSPNVYAELTKLSKVNDLKNNRVLMALGRPIYASWVGHAFRRIRIRSGVENFRFHDLRHDFCSRLVQAGQPLHVVAALAGHDDLSSTQRYSHLSPEVKRKAIASSFGYSLATIIEKGVTG